MSDAEALPGAIDRGKELARGFGGVDGVGRREAIVAIAAALGRLLAEMAQQDSAAARRRLDERTQRREPRAFARLPVGLDLVDALARADEILGAPEEMRDRGLAVAAGAAGFLIIGLDRLGQSGMRDETDVGLVDSHAKGDGGDHHHILARDEIMLVARARRRLEPGMIDRGRAARSLQASRRFSRSRCASAHR